MGLGTVAITGAAGGIRLRGARGTACARREPGPARPDPAPAGVGERGDPHRRPARCGRGGVGARRGGTLSSISAVCRTRHRCRTCWPRTYWAPTTCWRCPPTGHRPCGAGQQQPRHRFHLVSSVTDTRAPVRPDGLYGVSKVAVEALGSCTRTSSGSRSSACGSAASRRPRRNAGTWRRGSATGMRSASSGLPSPRRPPPGSPRCTRSPPTPAGSGSPATSTLAYTPVDDAEEYASRIPDGHLRLDPHSPQAGHFARPEFTLRHLQD